MNKVGKTALAFVVAGSMAVLGGCSSNGNTGAPTRQQVSSIFSRANECSYYYIEDQSAIKMFNTDNVYLMYDKETYAVKEILHSSAVTKNGVNLGEVLYLPNDEIISVYYDGDPDYTQNYGYRRYLFENNYVIPLGDAWQYIDGGMEMKDSYSLGEIRAMEPGIEKGLRIINDEKAKVKSIGAME